MRRFISMSLLLLFTLPVVSPLFAASTAEANIPACCRRNGKHHCMMIAAQSPSSGVATAKTASLREKCPCNFASPTAAHIPFAPDKIQQAIFSGILSHPACHAQTEARFRISFDRSRQKRGPPALIFSHS